MNGEGGAWDFTPAIDLGYAFSTKPDSISRSQSYVDPLERPQRARINGCVDNVPTSLGLGNFDRIWAALGGPPEQSPFLKKFEEEPASSGGVEESSGSDSQALEATTTKAVKWRDQVDGENLADIDEVKPSGGVTQDKTRNQRKKARRLVRKREKSEHKKALESSEAAAGAGEVESEKEIIPVEQSASKRRALINEIIHGFTPRAENVVPNFTTPVKHTDPTKSIHTASPLPYPIAKPHTPPSLLNKRSNSAPAPSSSVSNAFAQTASRKASLLTKLSQTFASDLPYLSSISLVHPPLDENPNLANGVHVFVDVSNILIGFHDALKSARKLGHIRRQPFSFHNLSLILERGRPIAKRVLAGSDNFPAIAEAQLIGYECNILDRVHKAKELTPRQKKFLRRSMMNGNGNGNGNNSSATGNGTTSGSGSETNTTNAVVSSTVTHAPEKWVEQAVDEILHLKILESVVDADDPATMVLATGDAAEAEYSPGFLKMVTRALGKGWSVEVVSFRKNISGMYKRREFRAKWGSRFKIVELDDYVEELVGVEV